MKNTQITKQELIEKMKSCEQTKVQSVYQHGVSVKDYLFDIINHLKYGKTLKYKWSIPQCIYDNKKIILNSLPNEKTLELYTVFHDCGKPFCLELDSNGKRHFPNHAKISYDVFNDVFNDDIASYLILHDMDIHLLKSDGVEEFSKNQYSTTLLLTGLAEIHSNCELFGGTDSTSFKIKLKSITQRAKQLFKLLKK